MYNLSATDYYAFGSSLKSSGTYKYGYQGQEKDPEWEGNYAFEYRIHDPRLGRFLSIDPLYAKYPHNSTYAFAENNVIRFIELEGLEIAEPQQFQNASEYLDKVEAGVDRESKTKVEGLNLGRLITDLRTDVANAAEAARNGSLGNYCGGSELQYTSLMYNPEAYVKYILNLAIDGKASFGDNCPVTKLAPKLKKDGLKGIETTKSSGEIFVKSLHYTTKYKGYGLNILVKPFLKDGSTQPYEIERMMGYVGLKAEFSKIYPASPGFDDTDLNKMCEAANRRNLIPMLFDNHGISYAGKEPEEGIEGAVGVHFFALLKMSYDDYNTTYKFKEGSLGVQINKITTERFKSSLKAYYIPVRK